MIGYKMMADSYRKLQDEGKGDFTKDIQIYDLLAQLDEDDKYKLFDSGLFNDIVKSYCQKACENVGAEHKEILRELGWLFDTVESKNI